MKIVLLGFDFICPNKGCEALSYSFVAMLQRLFKDEHLEIHNITHKKTLGQFPKVYPKIKFRHYRVRINNPVYRIRVSNLLNKANAVFDITYGDSFSDIYGVRWLNKTNDMKLMALSHKAPFVLLPQTYGPYEDIEAKKSSIDIINKTKYVYSRDQLSAEYIKRECGKEIKVVTDLAFALPYDKNKYSLQTEKIKVGINVSSLLWEGGFTKNNQFGLKVDYIEYNKKLIEKLLHEGIYEVHLIPHVVEDVEGAPENDLRPCRELKEIHKEVIIAPDFKTPIDAKSYISQMDVFIGARMHATIGAFSSGVATIPFSYSRKFEGLYGNLDYKYVLSGKELDTDEAISQTIEWINKKNELKEKANKSMDEINKKLKQLEKDIVNILKQTQTSKK